MHEVLFNRLGGLSLPMKSVVRLTDRPDMTLDVYRGRKTITHNTTHSLPVRIYNLEASFSPAQKEKLLTYYESESCLSYVWHITY